MISTLIVILAWVNGMVLGWGFCSMYVKRQRRALINHNARLLQLCQQVTNPQFTQTEFSQDLAYNVAKHGAEA